MCEIRRKYLSVVVALFFQPFYWPCEGKQLPMQILKRVTSDAAVYPGMKKTGLKMAFSELGSFDDLVESAKREGFLKIGLFCVERGAFILYRKPNFNIDNADDFKIASGENRCFAPTGIESAQPVGPLTLPKRDSITFFTKKNFASIAHPTALPVTRSFFASIKSSIKSLIIIGTKRWTLVNAKGDKYCVQPTDYDSKEKNPICMLSDLSETKINGGINIVRVLSGCAEAVNVTVDVNYCSYWGAVPNVTTDGSKTMVEDDTNDEVFSARNAASCTGGGEQERLLNGTLYFFKSMITGDFDKNVVLDFPGAITHKWKLEMLDMIWDIAKRATPENLVSNSYMNKIRELFVSELANAWKKNQADDGKTGNSGGKDEIVVGLLTEYDYRGLLYHTQKCFNSINEDQVNNNWVAFQSITNPFAVDEQVWTGLKLQKDFNIVIEMTWVVMNMVGGLCHKSTGYTLNYWALYIHFVVNMYLSPVADEEWVHPAKLGDMNIILGGDMITQYNKLAIFASVALFSANSLEPFRRPISETTPKIKTT